MADKHDFESLMADLWGASGNTPGAPERPAEMAWDLDYPNAIERCLRLNDPTALAKLLNERKPIHPMLLPALADALIQRGRPSGPGRRRKLTSMETAVAALQVQMARRAGSDLERAIENVAVLYKVSESVVQRAYNAKYPVWQRPSQKRRKL